ncbi:TIGR04283 family arsenosugar biosynthesis glycosyltransferase [Rufibacter quisquiliarum]|uniref:RSAM/selenodomain-associated transferase 2 n=1 Tax=Rufibacter quisquiliarum TaxID=1549639 RepID=A0A839GBK6_9BACT|nr:TIGR04283 family arsenosugar biosynthesis glycosyltransferase [Rufibacter quisquiliarum]MBA9076322.1 rSAM/selenodomain-associated transferase 2 [Rufibacter quisquiliarum]
MELSIIIPTYQEASGIGRLVSFLLDQAMGQRGVEVLVVDAQSTDGTQGVARAAGARVVESAVKSRAVQMNVGARAANGRILYFLHADTYPPAGFIPAIIQAVQRGHAAGCFRLAFDLPHRFLQFFCWFTRFNVGFFRFGDQSLFVLRELFLREKGFKETLLVMEDQELVRRLQRQTRFTVLRQQVTTSARKYRENGVVRLQLIFTLLMGMYYLGFSQQKIVAVYRRLIQEKRTASAAAE